MHRYERSQDPQKIGMQDKVQHHGTTMEIEAYTRERASTAHDTSLTHNHLRHEARTEMDDQKQLPSPSTFLISKLGMNLVDRMYRTAPFFRASAKVVASIMMLGKANGMWWNGTALL
jgi:hypothetical protein